MTQLKEPTINMLLVAHGLTSAKTALMNPAQYSKASYLAVAIGNVAYAMESLWDVFEDGDHGLLEMQKAVYVGQLQRACIDIMNEMNSTDHPRNFEIAGNLGTLHIQLSKLAKRRGYRQIVDADFINLPIRGAGGSR